MAAVGEVSVNGLRAFTIHLAQVVDGRVVESHCGAEWNIRLVYLGQSVESRHRFMFPSHQLLFLVRDFLLGLEAEEESVEAIDDS